MIAKLFTDTSATHWPVILDSDSRRIPIWREPGSQYRPSNIIEKDHLGRSGLMVWSGIMADGHTDLYVFDRCAQANQRYKNEILAPYVRLFRGEYTKFHLYVG
ncbi:transposable element Tcb2 transposase [Trichonephila clavipes]|uniref:Transposable element Tcb2 transposase n=1 Tax=Trichonephila clavipes TaxID=2585209 RepID=A0A8X6S7W1_TRICX|nr:transposable element Tcb2 transposase [Trichonephila clavipes]